MSDQEYLLRMEGIVKVFTGVVALGGVDFKVRRGEVHALMGENGAGKSTLMKCLFGIYHADAGEIFLDGKKVKFHGAKDALDAGVSMIHQELSNVPDRSVQENIWLGREPCRRAGPFLVLDHRKMRKDTIALMASLELDIEPDVSMRSLSVSRQQTCEIARAVSSNAKIIVMDEPTSSISEKEVDNLFKIILDLKARGVSVVYISHKMSEIFRIADSITVMRDGKAVQTRPAGELDEDKLISLMVGRDSSSRFPPLRTEPGPVRLSVEGLTSSDPRSFKDINFDLREGEILGIGGLVGAQRTELVEALFGLRDIASGTIRLGGVPVNIRSSVDAIAHGIGLITEDRRGSGIFPLLSIALNTAIPSLGRYRNFAGMLNRRAIQEEAKRLNEAIRTKTPSMDSQIQFLSGGNQQKVLVSRWLMTLPDILIMDEPTKGIDVGAKYEIYSIMVDLVAKGKSIIMVSSEMPELIAMSHRILVLCAGRHTGTLERDEVTQESVMRLATQFI
jgi:methyl-galactoside transport system ATP-binding protein